MGTVVCGQIYEDKTKLQSYYCNIVNDITSCEKLHKQGHHIRLINTHTHFSYKEKIFWLPSFW